MTQKIGSEPLCGVSGEFGSMSCGVGAHVADVTFFGGQLVDAEVLEHRIDVRIPRAAGAAIDLHLDDAFGRGSRGFSGTPRNASRM